MQTTTISPPDLPESEALFERALDALPGGNSRTPLFVPPHPPYADHGEGCELIDVDGNRLLDLQNNYTTLIHGHANPQIIAAVTEVMASGTCFGLPTRHEIELAEILTSRIAWARHWRFANSGSEAVMMAIRAARAFTGRDQILRFDRCYHGSYESVTAPGARGVPAAVAALSSSATHGDEQQFMEMIAELGDQLACVVIDAMPNRAGLVPASESFMKAVRAETEKRGIVMLQDEVLTYRIALGGLHSTYGVSPDLVTLGKVIGGGFPVGAIGGREEVMAVFDPRGDTPVSHGGTFSANPVTLRAGIEALKLFDQAAVDRLNAMGDSLRKTLASRGWDVTGRGSLIQVHVDDIAALWWRLYGEGILVSGNGLICLSTPMEQGDLDRAAAAFGDNDG